MEQSQATAIDSVLGSALAARVRATCLKAGLSPMGFCAETVRRAIAALEKRAGGRGALDKGLATRLRGVIAHCVARSYDWSRMIDLLAEHDLAFEPAGGGLAVLRRSTGERLARASDVGPGYGQLVRRFRAGFPGHPQKSVEIKALDALRQAEGDAAARPADDKFVVLYYDEAAAQRGAAPFRPRGAKAARRRYQISKFSTFKAFD